MLLQNYAQLANPFANSVIFDEPTIRREELGSKISPLPPHHCYARRNTFNILLDYIGKRMTQKRLCNVALAAKALTQSEFPSLAVMQRWRRLVAKYHRSLLIRYGRREDFVNVARAYIALETINMSAVAKAAAIEAMFGTYEVPQV